MTADTLSHDLRGALWRALAPAVPRLLSQLERDPDAPLFGCFDRDHWHYKMRDFSSAILQQGLVSLDALGSPAAADLPGNVLAGNARAGEWSRAALGCWARLQRESGGFDEYYPREQGFPPAAFGLYAAGLWFARRGWPEPEPRVAQAMNKACAWLLKVQETQALNQESAALAGLALAARVPGVSVDPERLEARLAAFFDSQAEAGWFPEYGGPDTGYLSVTLDCLWDYHEATGDPRAMQAMAMAVDFLALMAMPGGELGAVIPTMANARNTDYIAPYGLTRLGRDNPTASALVRVLFGRADHPSHFLNATDDRYFCHYLGQSAFRALEHLDDLGPATALPKDGESQCLDPASGLYLRHERGSSLAFAGRKGGVCYLYGPAGLEDADFGWRAALENGKVAATHWQDQAWQAALELEHGHAVLRCLGPAFVQGFAANTPLRHMVLRILSRVAGRSIIPRLKKRLIFKAGTLPLQFERRLVQDGLGWRLEDVLEGPGVEALALRPAPAQSLRHVASAARFLPEELLDQPAFTVRTEPGRFRASRRLGK